MTAPAVFALESGLSPSWFVPLIFADTRSPATSRYDPPYSVSSGTVHEVVETEQVAVSSTKGPAFEAMKTRYPVTLRPPVAGGTDQDIKTPSAYTTVVGADIWLGATADQVLRSGLGLAEAPTSFFTR
jgi:hypothetical protein